MSGTGFPESPRAGAVNAEAGSPDFTQCRRWYADADAVQTEPLQSRT
jgi:hypothetical protein